VEQDEKKTFTIKIGEVAFNEAGPFQAGLTRLEWLYKHCARAR
jgi:hypothetical protein